ncbi:MAG: hypothetical protein M3P10_01770, partial [Actinomycetota bacterium]|nr:hypothetical protein [Actinomycetota bacterium]
RGAVATREQLLSEVWGYSFDPGSNVVTSIGSPEPIPTARGAVVAPVWACPSPGRSLGRTAVT